MNAVLQEMVWCMMGLGVFSGVCGAVQRFVPPLVMIVANRILFGALFLVAFKIALVTLI